MVPKAEVHGRTNAEIDTSPWTGEVRTMQEQLSRMSKAAGLDKFVGNKFGRAKHVRRELAKEDILEV